MSEHKEDQNAHAKQNAAAWLENMVEMIQAVGAAEEAGDSKAEDEARQRIQDSPLSVEVRDGWRSPGDFDGKREAEEYRVLLSTGGPALRIIGDLDSCCQPENARLQWQDWFTPWTDFEHDHGSVLLTFAQQFSFGD